MKSIISLILDFLFSRDYKAEIISKEAKILLSRKGNLNKVMDAVIELEKSDKKHISIDLINSDGQKDTYVLHPTYN